MTRTGKILTQSLAIIEYLELNYPRKSFTYLYLTHLKGSLSLFIERPMWPKAIYHRAKVKKKKNPINIMTNIHKGYSHYSGYLRYSNLRNQKVFEYDRYGSKSKTRNYT